MSQAAKGTTGLDPFKTLRQRRDKLLGALARATLRVTRSRPYLVVSTALSRPALIAAGASRKATAAASAQLLAQLHLPSREDVLALSQRLTHIEMVLDDISAAQAAAAAASAKARASTNGPQHAAAGRHAPAHRASKA